MHFVNAYRGVKSLAFLARGHPFSIVPPVAVQVPDHGSRFGAQLGRKPKGSDFIADVALVAGLDFIFVQIPLSQTGNEDFPQTGCPPRPHGVASAVPLVEITDHAHPLGAGRPHRKMDPCHALVVDQVRTEFVVQPEVIAFRKKVQIELGQKRREAIRVFDQIRPDRQEEK